jgi:predicted metal-binding protein
LLYGRASERLIAVGRTDVKIHLRSALACRFAENFGCRNRCRAAFVIFNAVAVILKHDKIVALFYLRKRAASCLGVL